MKALLMSGGLDSAAFLREMRVLGGRVLVREQAVTSGVARWFLFAHDGTPLGFLGLPRSAALLDMTDTRLLVTETGALDVPQVVLYEIDLQP
jgi:hypothetical protein